MPAWIPNAFVLNLPYIKRVRQDFVEVTARKGQTADRSTAGRRIWLGRELEASEFGLDPLDVFEFQKQVKDRPDGHGLGFIDGESAVLSVIADRYPPSHPHAALLGRRDLVADPLTRDFSLELRKGQEDIQGQAPHRRCGIELLGDRDKGATSRVEDFDDFREIRQ